MNDRDRLTSEIKEELLHAHDVKGWLSSLPEPETRAIARARADARAMVGDPPRASLVPKLAGAAILACAALLALQVGPVRHGGPRAVALELAPSAEPTAAAPGVMLTPNGVGTVAGTEKNIVIDWQSGE